MPTFNPYLNFSGNTEEAFNFYRSVFGGEFAMIMRFKDTPEAGKNPPPMQPIKSCILLYRSEKEMYSWLLMPWNHWGKN